jgi:hypothetical protein
MMEAKPCHTKLTDKKHRKLLRCFLYETLNLELINLGFENSKSPRNLPTALDVLLQLFCEYPQKLYTYPHYEHTYSQLLIIY